VVSILNGGRRNLGVQGGDSHTGHTLSHIGVQSLGLLALVVVGVGHLDLIAQIISGSLIAGGQELKELVLLEDHAGDHLLAAIGITGFTRIVGGIIAGVVGGIISGVVAAIAAGASSDTQHHHKGKRKSKDFVQLFHYLLPPKSIFLYASGRDIVNCRM